MGGCADLLGYGDLKDRVADGGGEAAGSSSGSSSSGGSAGGSSGSSSSGSGSSGSSGGASSSSSSGGSSGGDGGTCTPLAVVPGSVVVPYTPVQQMLNACLQQQITGFITACTSSTASQQSCMNWQNDPNNSGCLACLIPSDSTGMATGAGALLIDAQQGFFTSNVPGCLALIDPTNGPKCAAEYEPQLQCAYYGCAGCAASAFNKCITAITTGTGACASYTIPDCSKDVFPDGGTYNNACSGPTDMATTQAVLTVICGGGV
jgi:hypothetical protein